MTIAITGATGHLGHLVINQLKAKAKDAGIIALVRTPAKAADLGVTTRTADYSQPSTLEDSLSGVETLLLISSNEIGQRAAQHHGTGMCVRQPSQPLDHTLVIGGQDTTAFP